MIWVVVQRPMQEASVVPKRDRPIAPTEPAGEFRFVGVFDKIIEKWATFFFGHIGEAVRPPDVDVQRF